MPITPDHLLRELVNIIVAAEKRCKNCPLGEGELRLLDMMRGDLTSALSIDFAAAVLGEIRLSPLPLVVLFQSRFCACQLALHFLKLLAQWHAVGIPDLNESRFEGQVWLTLPYNQNSQPFITFPISKNSSFHFTTKRVQVM